MEYTEQKLEKKSCLDCIHHRIINDPDPNDWFCHDDVAIICSLTKNPNQDLKSRYVADRQEFRPVSVSIRPHKVQKESEVPSWCPKNKS